MSQAKLLQLLTPVPITQVDAMSELTSVLQKIENSSTKSPGTEATNTSVRNERVLECSEQHGIRTRYQDVSSLLDIFRESNNIDDAWSSSDILSSMLKYTDMDQLSEVKKSSLY